MVSQAWKRGSLRTGIVAAATASFAAALVVVIPSAADQDRRPGRDDRSATARNVIFLHGDDMGP